MLRHCLNLIFVIQLIYNYLCSSIGVGIGLVKDDSENVVQFATGRETSFFEGPRPAVGIT